MPTREHVLALVRERKDDDLAAGEQVRDELGERFYRAEADERSEG